jgi:hypothetical protein
MNHDVRGVVTASMMSAEEPSIKYILPLKPRLHRLGYMPALLLDDGRVLTEHATII